MNMTDGAAPAATNDGPLSFDAAVGLMNGQPPKDDEPATPDDEPAGAAEPESPPDGDDAEPAEAPGEPEAQDEADEPPVKPPRTWTKAEKEAFALLPREHQQAIVDRESERDTYYQRGLQEAASKAKAAEAREQAAEQARQQYENALPALYQQFTAQFQAEFQDIKTWDDVSAMRQNDPMRYMAWQEAREKGNALAQQTAAAQQRQQQEAQQNWANFVNAETQAFTEKAPEFSNPETMAKAQAQALETLVDVGFGKDELAALWDQGKPLSLRDHRVMLLVRDAMKYRAAQQAAKTATKKPVPPVQRPGTAPAKGEAAEVGLKILNDKLSRSGRLEDAVAILNARSRKRA